MFWRTLNRYRRRIAFVGAAFAAAGVFTYMRKTLGQGIGGWAEASAWAFGVFIVCRWALLRAFDIGIRFAGDQFRQASDGFRSGRGPDSGPGQD